MCIRSEMNLGGLVKYLPVIENFSEQQRKNLIENLNSLKKLE